MVALFSVKDSNKVNDSIYNWKSARNFKATRSMFVDDLFVN